MFTDITINTGHLFAGVIAAHYICKGLDWLQAIPARRRARKALRTYERAKAAMEEIKKTSADTAAALREAIKTAEEAAADFAQPTAENLPPAKSVQPDCMFMAALDHPVAGASCPRPLPGRPAPIPTVTSNGNPITL